MGKKPLSMAFHKWSGLLSGIFLLVITLTGSILVFHKEIDHWQFKDYLEVDAYNGQGSLDKALQTAWEKFPEREVRIRHFDKDNNRKTIELDVRKGQERKLLFVHPSTGKIIHELNAENSITRWLLKFHYSLHAGTAGVLFITRMGFFFLLAIITGIIVYWGGIRKVFLFRSKITRKNRYAFFSSMHRVVGVWALIFNLMMALTGFLLAFSISSHRLGSDSQQPPVYQTNIETSIDSGITMLSDRHPDFKPDYLRMPVSTNQPARVYGYSRNSAKIWGRYANSAKIDVKTGKVLDVKYANEMSAGSKFNALVISLHFGDYGGWPIKLLYAVLGISPALLSITGFWLWWKKRK